MFVKREPEIVALSVLSPDQEQGFPLSGETGVVVEVKEFKDGTRLLSITKKLHIVDKKDGQAKWVVVNHLNIVHDNKTATEKIAKAINDSAKLVKAQAKQADKPKTGKLPTISAL